MRRLALASRLLARTATAFRDCTDEDEADGAVDELDGAGLLEHSWRNDGGKIRCTRARYAERQSEEVGRDDSLVYGVRHVDKLRLGFFLGGERNELGSLLGSLERWIEVWGEGVKH
jgi:hypothetical protein